MGEEGPQSAQGHMSTYTYLLSNFQTDLDFGMLSVNKFRFICIFLKVYCFRTLCVQPEWANTGIKNAWFSPLN